MRWIFLIIGFIVIVVVSVAVSLKAANDREKIINTTEKNQEKYI